MGHSDYVQVRGVERVRPPRGGQLQGYVLGAGRWGCAGDAHKYVHVALVSRHPWRSTPPRSPTARPPTGSVAARRVIKKRKAVAPTRGRRAQRAVGGDIPPSTARRYRRLPPPGRFTVIGSAEPRSAETLRPHNPKNSPTMGRRYRHHGHRGSVEGGAGWVGGGVERHGWRETRHAWTQFLPSPANSSRPANTRPCSLCCCCCCCCCFRFKASAAQKTYSTCAVTATKWQTLPPITNRCQIACE